MAKRLGRSSWFSVHIHGSSNHACVRRGIQIPSGARLPAAKVWAEVLLNWRKICLRIEVQYLGNAAWYGVGVKMTYRKPPKLYSLSIDEVTFDIAKIAWPWKVKDRLASYDRPSLPKLSFYSASALLAMQSAEGFCPSVRPSVTFRYCVQTNEDTCTIVRFSASGRTIPLVSGAIKFIRIFAGDHPQRGR